MRVFKISKTYNPDILNKQKVVFMRLFNLSLVLSILFSFSAQSQTYVNGRQLMELTPKGGIEIDTSKQTTEDPIDGVRTEIKSKETGAKKADETYRNLGLNRGSGILV